MTFSVTRRSGLNTTKLARCSNPALTPKPQNPNDWGANNLIKCCWEPSIGTLGQSSLSAGLQYAVLAHLQITETPLTTKNRLLSSLQKSHGRQSKHSLRSTLTTTSLRLSFQLCLSRKSKTTTFWLSLLWTKSLKSSRWPLCKSTKSHRSTLCSIAQGLESTTYKCVARLHAWSVALEKS